MQLPKNLAAAFRRGRPRLGPCGALVICLAGLALPLPALGRSNAFLEAIPDNAVFRTQQAQLLLDPVARINASRNARFEQELEPRAVRLQVLRQEERGVVYLSYQNRVGGAWPDTAPGNVVIRRVINGGGVDQVKFFLQENPLVYARAVKNGSASLLSVFYEDNDQPLYRDLPLPLSIERVSLLPLATLVRMTDARINWGLFMERPDAGRYEASRHMVREIRSTLLYLPDAEDGAMDENGKLVKIASNAPAGQPGFNCSGFAKWVADGLYWPLSKRLKGSGAYLKISELTLKHPRARADAEADQFEDSRDPWFGLDWTRNIANRLAALRYGQTERDSEDQDVRQVPFLAYEEDRGYPIGELEKTLYLLAIQEPDHFYLAAVNGRYGERPVLWQYYHVVVLFPYFDEAGAFRCAVFDRNVESSLGSLLKRYPNDYAHLVRIRSSLEFTPPLIR